jgi:hypothetical protein
MSGFYIKQLSPHLTTDMVVLSVSVDVCVSVDYFTAVAVSSPPVSNLPFYTIFFSQIPCFRF